MNELTADVNLCVIVRRDGQRHGPYKTIFQVSRDVATRVIRPHFDVARLPGLDVVNLDDTANAARAGRAGPDDVVIDRIGRGPTALTTGDVNPSAARNYSAAAAAATKTARSRPAGSTIRRTILPIAVNIIRNQIISGDVIELTIRQLDSLP